MRRLFIASVTALLLGACASHPPPKRLLLAYDGPVPAEVTSARPRLVVRAVSIPDYLDRRELVRRVDAAEVQVEHGAVWAERPGKSITRFVAQSLAAQRPDYSVEAYATADGHTPDAVLAITLEGFEPGPDGIVRLRGSWRYLPVAGTAALTGRFDSQSDSPSATPEASVAALRTALGSAVKTLATALPAASAIAVNPVPTP